jgi:hypothetical protein
MSTIIGILREAELVQLPSGRIMRVVDLECLERLERFADAAIAADTGRKGLGRSVGASGSGGDMRVGGIVNDGGRVAKT